MADVEGGSRENGPDPLSTPLNPNADTAEVERYRASLIATTEKEKAERAKFHLKAAAITGVSDYHRDKHVARANATAAGGHVLNLNDERATGTKIVRVNPTGVNPPPGALAPGAPPPPSRPPPANQLRITVAPAEFDANGLPIFSTPMDNVMAGEAALAQLVADGEGGPTVQYASNLLRKAREQQLAGCNSQG